MISIAEYFGWFLFHFLLRLLQTNSKEGLEARVTVLLPSNKRRIFTSLFVCKSKIKFPLLMWEIEHDDEGRLSKFKTKFFQYCTVFVSC